jgi:hypothetical protein
MTGLLLAAAALAGLGCIALGLVVVIDGKRAVERARREADEEWIDGGFAAAFERRELERDLREAGL